MPHSAPEQDRSAAARSHGLIGADEIVDQLVVQQIVRRLGKRNDADLAIDFVRNGCHLVLPSSMAPVSLHRRYSGPQTTRRRLIGFRLISIVEMSLVI